MVTCQFLGIFASLLALILPLECASFQGRGHIETCDDIDLRRILGKEYLKFDEKQLNNALSAGE